MTELKEFTEFADGPLVFPYRGKKYTAPEVTIELGARLIGITDREQEQNLELIDLVKDMLGPVYDEMVADGVPLAFLTRVGETLLCDFQFGRTYAAAFWETGGDPKAMTDHMKALGNRASRRSKSTGKGTATQSPASTSTTTSRHTSQSREEKPSDGPSS